MNIIIIIIIIISYIEYINDEWSAKHIWNYEQLMKDKNEIQESLLCHLLHDSNHELVSKSVFNIMLVHYRVNCFRRHSG